MAASVNCVQKHPHGRGEDTSPATAQCPHRETPPRAWGRPYMSSAEKSGKGNTPTGVGKTIIFHFTLIHTWKHPHGRGEDFSILPPVNPVTETPPRAWGRPPDHIRRGYDLGNTPTGVGKTIYGATFQRVFRKHPHGRGEDLGQVRNQVRNQETPPRAWGRLIKTIDSSGNTRNTPTGVGKTKAIIRALKKKEKHPHGRGEDQPPVPDRNPPGETPPRAWGRPQIFWECVDELRNTPTGVGKTPMQMAHGISQAKHPHGRGEDLILCLIVMTI